MATITRSGVKKKKAPPGFRWKTVTKVNAMGRPYTTHVLVPIESTKVPPETIFTAEESIRGAEDRKDSMSDIVPGEKRRLREATIPLDYGQDDPRIDDGLSLLDTKVLLDQTQAKRRVPPPPQYPSQASGALPTEQPSLQSQLEGKYGKFDPYGGIGTGGGMDDPTWSRAERQASGTVPFNPYKDNVGPMYSGQPHQKGLLAGTGPRGTFFMWGDDGQAIYMEDVIDIGAAGKIKTAKGVINVGKTLWDRARKFFRGKKKSEFDETAEAAAARTARTKAQQAEKKIPLVGDKAAEAVAGATKGASTIKGTSRTRRALSKIAPGRKTELVVAGALSAGLAGELTDNALWNRFKDATAEQLKQYGFLPEQIAEMAKDVGTTLKRAATETTSEWEARIAREKSGKAIRAKGLLDIPDKDARAGTEFFGAGDVAGDTLIPEKAKTPVAAVEDPLKKFWGKYADDPAKRKQKYLDSLSSIWRKAAIMDAIAAATGGESRSPQFMAMMSQRMDAIAKFDDEERLHNIFKAVYYNPETGVYNAPKNKTDAYERAIKLGASPAEAKKIFGYQPEPDEALHEWYYKDPVTNEYVTEHVRGKATMPEGDYNWSKGKTPVLTEAAEDLGGTVGERSWNEINTILDRGGDLPGRFDDALRAYMRAMKVDQYTGFDLKQAKQEAEQRIMGTMDSSRRQRFTYPRKAGEEITPELLKKAREAGYLFIIDDEGVERPILTRES